MGYDPGGNASHGLALFSYKQGQMTSQEILTCRTANEVIDRANSIDNLIAIGVDTLTCWSTGQGAWRPADRWLREKYPTVINSIMTPNRLSGSMGLNGMSVLLELHKKYPNLHISETHPKVLYHALTNKRYNYPENNNDMDLLLSELLKSCIRTNNDHEWDAVISAYSVYQGRVKKWELDLHTIPVGEEERQITPCGTTHYWWPGQKSELGTT